MAEPSAGVEVAAKPGDQLAAKQRCPCPEGHLTHDDQTAGDAGLRRHGQGEQRYGEEKQVGQDRDGDQQDAKGSPDAAAGSALWRWC
jgi:hypothetical protein